MAFSYPHYIFSRLDMHSEVQPFVACRSVEASKLTVHCSVSFLRFKIKRFMFTLVCFFTIQGTRTHLEYVVPSTKNFEITLPSKEMFKTTPLHEF